jgi:hypothetical protein
MYLPLEKKGVFLFPDRNYEYELQNRSNTLGMHFVTITMARTFDPLSFSSPFSYINGRGKEADTTIKTMGECE